MNSEERFRRSLEDLLSSKEFAFDEANWDKAQQLIDGSKKPNRTMMYVASAILVIGALTTGVYFLSGIFSTSTNFTTLHTNKKAETPKALPLTQAISESLVENSAPIKTAGEQTFSVDEKNSQVSTKQVPTRTLELTESKAKNSITSIPEKENAQTDANSEKSIPASSFLPETLLTHTTNETDIKETNKNKVASTTTSPTKENGAGANDKTDLKSSRQTSINADLAQPQGDVEELFIASNEPLETMISDTIKEHEKKSFENFATDVSSPLKNDVADNDDENRMEQNHMPVKELEDTLVVAVSKPDTSKNTGSKIQNVPIDNDKGELGKPKDYPVLFSVEAGASYLFGWQNGGSRDANGFNPTIGLNYFNNFSAKMSLTFGLHYSSVSNLSYSNYTSKVIRLGFGEESKVTVFTPVKVHYLTAPLRLNYKLTPLNMIGVGVNIAYLLTIESEVEDYTEKFSTKYNQTLSKTSGYTEGFKQFDTQLSVFYTRRLYPNLSLNLEIFYGVTDIKDNTFFNSNVFERNSGMKLTLVYNFLKR